MPLPFIVYLDETGDHGMETIDPASPVFALMAAVYTTEKYLQHDLAELTKIKFDFWRHDNVVFRSHSIRNKNGHFSILTNPATEAKFSQRIAEFFATSQVKLIAAGIHKVRHKAQYSTPENPYSLAVQFVLERIFGELRGQCHPHQKTILVFESRGKKEDKEVTDWCTQVCRAGSNYWKCELPFEPIFASKQTNSVGLQVADLAAYPTSHYVKDPTTQRRDWLAIEPRIRRSPSGQKSGWGLKIFP